MTLLFLVEIRGHADDGEMWTRRAGLFPEAAGVAAAARDAAQSETESNADDDAPDHSVSQA